MAPVMTASTEELERPSEWLRRFAEDDAAYRELLLDSGCIAVAAYRLARARCRVQPMAAALPTLAELRAAADDIAARTDLPRAEHIGVLVADCELAGLTIILPPSFDSAA